MNLDKTFKNKIEQLNGIPSNVCWNKNANWDALLKHRRRIKIIRNRRILLIAASISMLILFTWIYLLQNEDYKKLDFISQQALLKYEEYISKDYTRKYIIDYSKKINKNCTIIYQQDYVIVFK